LNRTLEARVETRTRELSEANRELETFAYSVSHDLRAPLRAIEGFSRVLVDRHAPVLDDTGRGYLERVRNAAARMSELIEGLLKVSRVARGDLVPESLDLSRMAHEIIAELRADRSAARRDRGHPPSSLRRPIAPGAQPAAEPARQCVEVHARSRRRAHRVRQEDDGVTFYVQDNGDGLRPGLCRQTLPAVPALARRRAIRGRGHRPCDGEAHRRTPWRRDPGLGRNGEGRGVLVHPRPSAAERSGVLVVPAQHALLLAVPVAFLAGLALVVRLLALREREFGLDLVAFQYSAVGTSV
jgi:hypothetical protein